MKLTIDEAPFNPYSLRPSGLKHWRVQGPGWSWFVDSPAKPTQEQTLELLQGMAQAARGAASVEAFAKATNLPTNGPADLASATWAYKAYKGLADNLDSGAKVGAVPAKTKDVVEAIPAVPPVAKVAEKAKEPVLAPPPVPKPPPLPKTTAAKPAATSLTDKQRIDVPNTRADAGPGFWM